jgi:hypothetical protein
MLSFSSTATASSDVGSYAVNGSGLIVIGSNYTLAQAPTNATALTVNPAILTYIADPVNRTYGNTNPTFGGTVTGFVNGESQTSATTGALSFTSPATATSDVGSYAVDGSGLSANAGNYTFQQAATNGTALTINPAVLTAVLTGTVKKVYDGTIDATLSGVNYALTGVIGSDEVALNDPPSGSYASMSIGSNIPVSVSGLSLTGSKAGNYRLANSTITADIGTITAPVPPVPLSLLPVLSLLPQPMPGGNAIILTGGNDLAPLPFILSIEDNYGWIIEGETLSFSTGLPVFISAEQTLWDTGKGRHISMQLALPSVIEFGGIR